MPLVAQTNINTSVTVSSPGTPSIYGSPLTLTATVTPSAATGVVTFYDGVSILGTAPIASGAATFTTALLASGTRSITARYVAGANSGYNPSLSSPWTQAVNAQPERDLVAQSPGTFAGSGPYFEAVGDFDGDGKADLAIVDQNSNNVTVLLGNGAGGFAPSSNSPFGTGMQPSAIAVADFNGDGKSDLVVANFNAGTVTVLLGDGTGSFAEASGSPVTVGTGPFFVVVADFNGDGRADLAVANHGSGSVSVLLGDGTGSFAPASGTPLTAVSVPDAVAAGDFNGDGIADLAVANHGNSKVSIFLGDGSGAFAEASGSPITVDGAPEFLASGDFNGDGFADLAVIVDASGANLAILLGNGSGGFTEVSGSPFQAGPSPFSLAMGDYNGDAIVDLAVANSGNSTVTLLLGDGSGKFGEVSGGAFKVGSSPFSIVAGDFNGDGKTDMATANHDSSDVTILLGIGPARKLQVTQQPSAGTVGWAIGTVKVQVQDAAGNLLPSSTAQVTIFSTPAGVGGTLAVNAAGGIATFSNLVFNAANSYTLTASSSLLTSATSASIQITNPLSQTITFGALSSKALSASPFTVSATASSGLPVSFASSTSAVCSVSGNTVTLLALGTCTISAMQAGNANYSAAPPVSRSFLVTIGSQTITFAGPAPQFIGTQTIALSATASSGLPVSFATQTKKVCTMSGATAHLLVTGTCTIIATQAGNASYTAAAPVTRSFSVIQQPQTITFAGPASPQHLSVGTLTIGGSSTSGLPVSFATTSKKICTVSGTTVHLIARGTCVIQASQSGNADYAAATPVTQSFVVQ